MCKTTDKIIYWLTLIGPIIDVLKGTVLGLQSAYKAVKAERKAQEAEALYQKQREQFENDNSQTSI